jgi:RHS repeat-associated protein
MASDRYNYGIAVPVVYDANGNIRRTSVGNTSLTYNYAAAGGDRLEAITSENSALARGYNYDANGNVTGITGGRELTISYDRTTGLPINVKTQTATICYVYDGRGRRVAKRSDAAPKVYGYGTSPQPLVEWVGTSKSPTGYIYGPAGLAAVIGPSGHYYVFRDHERSPRVLCDTNGKIAASFDYLPFGTIARQNGDGTLLDRRFTGQEFDPETGLYNYKSRLYDADVGRFLSPDPAHQFFSPYLYAANNPLSFVDPTGQFAIIAAVVEGLVDLIALTATVGTETVEATTATTAVATTLSEGAETVAVGTEAVSGGTEALSTAVSTTQVAESSDAVVASSTEATTTSLSDASTVATEGAEVENGSVSSLETTSTRNRLLDYFLRWGDQPIAPGQPLGWTSQNPVPWGRWPLTYLNRFGLTAYNPAVTNNTVGAVGFADTAAHEGFHALVGQYAPFIWWGGDATIGDVPIGAPVKWAEETVAYGTGHFAAGRYIGVPLAPIEAFASLTPGEQLVTLGSFAVSTTLYFA